MKNLTNKKIIVICVLIILFCAGLLLGVFIGNLDKKEQQDTYEGNTISLDNQAQPIDMFYAKIEKISEYNGKISMLVNGLDVNDINHRGKYDLSIEENTILLWRGTKLKISDLKVGQNISITYDGRVLLSYPGQIPNVIAIKVLDDKI